MTEIKKNTKKTGDLGEKVAQQYLVEHDFSIVEVNYWRKWGEIDIIAKDTNDVIHFIEVKTVSHETKDELENAVAHETWRPEEQVTERKLHQIHKAIQTWLSENDYMGEFKIDVVAVRIVPRETYATINFIENVM